MREKILTFIEKNSRVDLRDLAVMLGVDEASVANEIAEMEKEGIICGYHTLIDWEKTGEEKLTALIEVKVTPQRGTRSQNMSLRAEENTFGVGMCKMILLAVSKIFEAIKHR